jgi:DNA-binding protein HU-beta
MTKAELISLIAKSTGVEKADTVSVVTAYMEFIKKSLEEGENVYLRGFGSFIIKKRAEKKARNISQNTTITIPEHNIPAFKPARVFIVAISNSKKRAKKKK